MERALYEVDVFPEKGRWPADLAGAVAIIAAVGLVVGLPDRDMREQLAPLLWGCFLVALAAGALYWVARRNLAHRLRVVVDGTGTRIELVERGKARTTLTAPVSVAYGKTEEFVSSGKGGRWVPVLWLLVSGGPLGESVVLKRAQGVLDAVPESWPEHARPIGPRAFSSVGLDPQRLLAALRQSEVP